LSASVFLEERRPDDEKEIKLRRSFKGQDAGYFEIKLLVEKRVILEKEE